MRQRDLIKTYNTIDIDLLLQWKRRLSNKDKRKIRKYIAFEYKRENWWFDKKFKMN